MFDFSAIQYNTENPTFITILFTVVCSFVLSSLIAFTYEKTSRNISTPANYIQSLILISIVAAMVMQAIGDSLARGLGMLGALAIIRFRTTLRDPRNIVFMFGSLATGIACGVLGFVIAFTGTITFCIVAFILRLTPFSRATNIVGSLSVEMPQHIEESAVINVIKEHSRKHLLKGYKTVTSGKKSGMMQYDYQIIAKESNNNKVLLEALKALPEVKVLKYEFADTVSNI